MNKNDVYLLAEAYQSILEQEAAPITSPASAAPTAAPAQQAQPTTPLQYFFSLAQKFGLTPNKSKTLPHIIERALAQRTRNTQQFSDSGFIDAMSNFTKPQVLARTDKQIINMLYDAYKRG